jgi:hypothetical protein
MRERERKENVKDINLRKKRVFSLLNVFFLLFTSFTVMVIIIPNQAKAFSTTTIVIDYNNCKDNCFSQWYALNNYGANAMLYVDPALLAVNRIAIQFDLSSLPSGCNVTSAILHMYYIQWDNNDPNGRYRDCWELSRSWVEGSGTIGDPDTTNGATWRYYDHSLGDPAGRWTFWPAQPVQNYRDVNGNTVYGDDGDRIDQCPVGSQQNWHNWTVTKSVQAFVDGTRTNYGWIIDDDDEGAAKIYATEYRSSEYSGVSYRPNLTIQYNLLYSPQVQTNDTTSISEQTATLNGYLTDAGAPSANVGFYYDTTHLGIGHNVSVGPYTDGSQFGYPVSSLNRGDMYYVSAWASNTKYFVKASNEKNFLTKPATLTNFVATAYNTTQINLTWTNNDGGKGAYIEYRMSQPMTQWLPKIGVGTPVNATGYISGTIFRHKGLSSGQTYYYKAWAYASDGGWKSSGNSSAPFGGSATSSNTTKAAGGGSWIGITDLMLSSSCGGIGLSGALDGTDTWNHDTTETHYFILDLGRNYTIQKVRGRSFTTKDPTAVDIYVSTSTSNWGTAVATNINTWRNTDSWQEYASTDKVGRYIKVSIRTTENVNNYIGWGPMLTGSNIFDAYGVVTLKNATYYFNSFNPAEQWLTNPQLMVDGDENKYASTKNLREVEQCNRNTCPGTDLGTISTVKIMAKGNWFKASNTITLRPIFRGIDGTGTYLFSCSSSPAWSTWFDITNDSKAPQKWAWSDVKILFCDVESGIGASSVVNCSMVKIKVDYIESINYPPVASFSRDPDPVDAGATVTLDASESYDDGQITNYSWDITNDGKAEKYGVQVSYNYSFANQYTIKLTVTDDKSTSSSITHTLNVSQKINVVHNSVNNGDNYITWGTEPYTAAKLYQKLGLSLKDSISKFDPAALPRDSWNTYLYVKGANDFNINTWDQLLIRVDKDKTYSFTPHTNINGTQNITMNFSKDGGWYYVTWSNNYTTTANKFIRDMVTKGYINNKENLEINLYHQDSDTWSNYNPSLDPVFQDNFIIHTYDVICFRVPSTHGKIKYKTADFNQY